MPHVCPANSVRQTCLQLRWRLLWKVPGVDARHTERCDMRNVARDDRQSVCRQGGGCDHGIGRGPIIDSRRQASSRRRQSQATKPQSRKAAKPQSRKAAKPQSRKDPSFCNEGYHRLRLLRPSATARYSRNANGAFVTLFFIRFIFFKPCDPILWVIRARVRSVPIPA
jgi:hypothetical protein